MKIKGHKDLFNAWKGLGDHIKSLGTIVQNDLDISDVDFVEWEAMLASVSSKFAAISKMTVSHCRGEKIAPPLKKDPQFAFKDEPKISTEGYLFEDET